MTGSVLEIDWDCDKRGEKCLIVVYLSKVRLHVAIQCLPFQNPINKTSLFISHVLLSIVSSSRLLWASVLCTHCAPITPSTECATEALLTHRHQSPQRPLSPRCPAPGTASFAPKWLLSLRLTLLLFTFPLITSCKLPTPHLPPPPLSSNTLTDDMSFHHMMWGW